MNIPEKKLITTLVIGEEIESLAKYTIPFMKGYARRVGADFQEMKATKIAEQLSPYYEKTQIYDLLDTYDRVLFIDADILIAPDAPNLFDDCPKETVAAVSVEGVYSAVEKEKQSLNKVLGKLDWNKEYFNSGVVMFPRVHRVLLNRTDGLIEKWIKAKESGTVVGLNDQSVFNYRVNARNIPMHYIDPSFNYTKAWGEFESRFSKHFIHYAGMKGNRLLRIKIDNRIISSQLLFGLFRRSKLLTRMFDSISLRLLS